MTISVLVRLTGHRAPADVTVSMQFAQKRAYPRSASGSRRKIGLSGSSSRHHSGKPRLMNDDDDAVATCCTASSSGSRASRAAHGMTY